MRKEKKSKVDIPKGFMSLGTRKLYKSGTSVAFAMPQLIMKSTRSELGDEVEVFFNGTNEMIVRFKDE